MIRDIVLKNRTTQYKKLMKIILLKKSYALKKVTGEILTEKY